MKTFRRFLGSAIMVFGLILLGCGGSNTAYAEGLSLTMSPMKQKIVVNPGDSYVGSVTIFNPVSNGKDLEYTVSVEPFYVDENYNSVFNERTSQNQIVDWITLNNGNYGTVAMNESQDINYTINVPEWAPGGGQYAAIIVTAKTPEGGAGMTISERQAIAHIVFAEVAGETYRQGEILDASVNGFLLSGKITASSTIKNTGNVHGTATYKMQIYPLFSDEEIYTNEEDPETRIIVPDRTFYNEITWDKTPIAGIFNVVYSVEFEGVTAEVSKMVIVCPVWLMFAVLFAVVAIIIWLILKRRLRRR